MTPSARIAVSIELLAAIDSAPRKPADAVANAFFRERRFIGSGDRRSVSELAWRILRTRRRLTWWLERASLRPTPRMLTAASLLTEGWSLSGLDQTFSGGQYGPSHLNAEERAALRVIEAHTLEHPQMPGPVLAEAPDWIFPRLLARFGEALGAEMAAMEQPAPLDLRVNLLKGTREDAQSALTGEGIEAAPTALSPWGLRVVGRRPVTTGPAFRSGLVEIQDEGSQVVAGLVDARPEMRVADWCAGAGGKTLALAMAMGNRGHIAACDVSAPRLDGAVKRLRRAGIHNVERHLLESGDKWAKRRQGSFDRVLVDAPCTGTGTWRRNPDGRLRLREADLLELIKKQHDILERAARVVRVGGRLVYATCSLLRDENEDQVRRFLDGHAQFAHVPHPAGWPEALAPSDDGFLSLTPLRHGTDGFFAAVLERVA